MPVFNAFESTNPRLKKNKPFSEGATAGTAKVSGRGAKSREELKMLGERNGWTDQEMSPRDVANLSADHYLWFESFFPARLEHASEIQNNGRLNAERMPIWNARRMWEGRATPEEDERARIAGDTFATRTPQFARTMENATLMVEHMKLRDFDATEMSSYFTAFRELTEQGKLIVAPAQSADQYLAAHAELHDHRTPPLIQVREAKAAQTAKHFEAAANSTAKGTVVNFTDYAADETGYPDYPSKYSFRRLVESLDADSYARRLKDDPQFAAAIDKLNNDNT